MIFIGIIIGMIIGYYFHSLLYKGVYGNFGNILVNYSEDAKILFEFVKSLDDIQNYEKVIFSVKNLRKNIDSSNGQT